MGHDVIRPGHAESEDAFGLEVEGLDLVVQPLLALPFGLGLGQELRLETGDQRRGKLGAVVANPAHGIVGVLDVVDAQVEGAVGLADQRAVLHVAVGTFGLEVALHALALAPTVHGVFVVDANLDVPGIDLPHLGAPEDGSERLPGDAALDRATGGGLRVQTDELALAKRGVQHEGFQCGVREDGHF